MSILKIIIPELNNLTKEDLIKTQKLLQILPNHTALRLAALFAYNKNNKIDFENFAIRMKMDKKTKRLIILLLRYQNVILKKDIKNITKIITEVNIHGVDLLFAYKKAILALECKNTSILESTMHIYQSYISQIISMKVSRIKFNEGKIKELGYSGAELELIYEDVKGKIISNQLSNNENEIKYYILKHYKRS